MASKPLYIVVAAVGIVAASGAAWWFQNKSGGAKAGASSEASAPQAAASGPGGGRAPAVEVARVETMKLTDDVQAVGSLRSRQGVMLRPEISGRVTKLNFRDGDRVRKGQLLVQLDDQLPQAQVQQAQAELSIAQANHKRNQELVAQNFISQRSVDESAANLLVAQAKLSLAQASAARLRILAPFDGIAGIRTVNVGDYLKDGADIVNIEDIDALFVDFRLPERFQSKLQRGQRALIDIDALPGRKFNAVVQAVDPLVDANGRSVGVRGCIDNRSLALRPGMFARVTTVFGERNEARVVPEEAIVPQGNRQSVIKLVDGPDGDTKIAQRVEVKVGIRRPGQVEITEGLQPGDMVVTAGQQRVQKDGMPVRVIELAKAPAGGPRPAGARPAAAAAAAPQAAASAPAGANPCAMTASAEARPAKS
ncbi:efflux RND transporter periplasmic adaptor subunit [uncultured Ramlibacter sp.]|uniref:efflux RND transporter periplasmic adaptor subunit n=1 Tax=uncultured Ramlibacter sp. TaxID=260755 RepID=UPI002622BD66|nr:efflux RND transporter periplasmic adaptor subunit [uncultured Ramlibacter sp.]